MTALQKFRSPRFRDSSFLHLLVVTLLGIPLITPLLHWTSVPCTHDGHLHYHRIAAMRYGWEQGLHFARWLPDVAFGYGYPFFIFREAPPLYLALFPHLLGMPLPAATNLFYILCVLASGWFMYLWVRDVFGSRSAVISAVAYMAAPYILIDALVRGNQPESMALALLPLILWSGRRFVATGSAGFFLTGSLSLTLLALSHNISLLLFTPLLIVYLVGVGWVKNISWKSIVIRVGLVVGLGLAMAAFYLGPALLELDQISISQSVSNRNNAFQFNFATLAEIFAPVKAADPSLLNPPLLLRLGWIPTALALAGVICLKWARNRERRAHIIFMLVAIVGLIFMAAPLSSAIWEHLPLIKFVQFPWRFVGRAALPLAFLAGVPFAYLPAGLQLSRTTVPLAPILTAAAAALLVLEALPHLYPHICVQEPFPTISTLHAYEHNTGMVGVDPTGSYFPNTVKVRPDGSLLESDYEAGETPRRFDVSVFPPGASLLESDYDLLSGRAIVDSPTPFKARYLTFYYPGWRVKVDGEPVPIIISDPDGLITIPVPAGEHTIEVFWSTTPVRGLFTAFSILAAIAVISLSFLIYRSRSNSVNNVVLKGVSDTADELPGGKLDWLTIGLLVAIGVGLLLFKTLLVDTERTPFYRQADAPVENRSRLVAGELRLDGFNIKADELSSGESFEIDLAWRVLEPPQADYQSNIWLRSSDGLTWSDKETYRPRIFEETAPSQFWLPGQWVWDSREIEALKGTPPGWYEIVLILFDKESLQPLTLIGVDGQTLGPEAVIGEIEVTEAESTAEIEPEMDINQEIDGLFLRGFNQDRFEVNPGESLLLTFFWEKLPDSEPSGEPMYLALKDSSEDIVQQWSIYPIREEYPSSEWPQDQLLRGQHVIQLGPDLESGVFSFYINGVKLGEVKVGDLERLFDQPDVGISISANFDEKAMLTGLTMPPDGIDESRQMEITLVWQGLEQMPVSYRVFIHLVNEQGDIVAQSDGIPAGWTRPTTGWLPGEYIVDKHVLDTRDIEVDQPMKLRIGLYDPATGARVTIANQEFVTLNLPAAGG